MFNFLEAEKKIIFIYIVLGLAWIYFSDTLLYNFAGDLGFFRNLQSFKGAFYVLATAILLYLLIKRYADNLKEQKKEVNVLNEELIAYNEELLAMNEELDQSLDELKEIKDSLFINITVNESVVGRISLDIAVASSARFKDTTKKILQSFATLASSFFAFKRFDKLQGRFTKELISSIINILEIYDSYTKGHSENVANLAASVAEKMGLSRKMVVDTYWAGMVHDIGKLLVPVSILNKKGSLS